MKPSAWEMDAAMPRAFRARAHTYRTVVDGSPAAGEWRKIYPVDVDWPVLLTVHRGRVYLKPCEKPRRDACEFEEMFGFGMGLAHFTLDRVVLVVGVRHSPIGATKGHGELAQRRTKDEFEGLQILEVGEQVL